MDNEILTTEQECSPESPDCGDPMCKMCSKKIWAGSAFENN